MAIAKLSIDLEARLAGLQQGLDRAGVLAERQADRISTAFAGARSAAAGLGAAFTVGAFATWIRSTVDGIDKLNDLADATGATVENLSALEDVAARTGTGIDTAGDAVLKLNKALNTASDPKSDAAKALDAIGLSVEELKRLDPVEALQRVGVALAGFADDGNKGRIVMELLGKSTGEIAPLLKDMAEAGKLVATVTKQEAEEAEKFNRELFAMQKSALDLSRVLIGPFVSSLNKAIAGIRDARGAWETLKAIDASAGILVTGVAPTSGGATGGWGDDAPKPSLPDTLSSPTKPRGGSSGSAKRAADERLRLAEFSARQLVEIEEQAAHDTADAWKAWERQQLDISKQRADAEKEQWRQVFEFIDQQQAEAIEQGQAVLDAAQKSTDGLAVFAEQAARNIQDALGNTLEATLSGNFDSIGAMWKNLLIRMASEAAAARIAKELFGDFGGAGGGSIGGSIGSLLALLPKFASGTDYVPRDMIAMVHRGERIVPAAENARGASSGAPALTYAPVIQIDSRTDQAQVAQLVAAGVQQGQRQMLAHLKASGVLA